MAGQAGVLELEDRAYPTCKPHTRLPPLLFRAIHIIYLQRSLEPSLTSHLGTVLRLLCDTSSSEPFLKPSRCHLGFLRGDDNCDPTALGPSLGCLGLEPSWCHLWIVSAFMGGEKRNIIEARVVADYLRVTWTHKQLARFLDKSEVKHRVDR